MKRVLLGLLAAAVGMTLMGCGGTPKTPDAVGEAMLKTMEQMAQVVSKITDKASAQKARPQLEKLVKKGKELGEKMKELDKTMTQEQKDALEKKFAPRGEKIMETMGPAMMKIMTDPEIAKELECLKDM